MLPIIYANDVLVFSSIEDQHQKVYDHIIEYIIDIKASDFLETFSKNLDKSSFTYVLPVGSQNNLSKQYYLHLQFRMIDKNDYVISVPYDAYLSDTSLMNSTPVSLKDRSFFCKNVCDITYETLLQGQKVSLSILDVDESIINDKSYCTALIGNMAFRMEMNIVNQKKINDQKLYLSTIKIPMLFLKNISIVHPEFTITVQYTTLFNSTITVILYLKIENEQYTIKNVSPTCCLPCSLDHPCSSITIDQKLKEARSIQESINIDFYILS